MRENHWELHDGHRDQHIWTLVTLPNSDRIHHSVSVFPKFWAIKIGFIKWIWSEWPVRQLFCKTPWTNVDSERLQNKKQILKDLLSQKMQRGLRDNLGEKECLKVHQNYPRFTSKLGTK